MEISRTFHEHVWTMHKTRTVMKKNTFRLRLVIELEPMMMMMMMKKKPSCSIDGWWKREYSDLFPDWHRNVRARECVRDECVESAVPCAVCNMTSSNAWSRVHHSWIHKHFGLRTQRALRRLITSHTHVRQPRRSEIIPESWCDEWLDLWLLHHTNLLDSYRTH